VRATPQKPKRKQKCRTHNRRLTNSLTHAYVRAQSVAEFFHVETPLSCSCSSSICLLFLISLTTHLFFSSSDAAVQAVPMTFMASPLPAGSVSAISVRLCCEYNRYAVGARGPRLR
jgi:hypothetical protein